MHLTTDEIINFVTMDSLIQENILLAARVNSHIMECEVCRKKVVAYQVVNDGLMGTILSVPQLDEQIEKDEPEELSL